MTEDKNWKPCPGGLLQDLAAQQEKTERCECVSRRTLFASVASVSAALGLAVWSRATCPGEELTCDEVHALADLYAAGQLPAQKATLMEAHCDHCPPCASFVQNVVAQNA